jgi:hypothetical protein
MNEKGDWAADVDAQNKAMAAVAAREARVGRRVRLEFDDGLMRTQLTPRTRTRQHLAS